MIDIPDRDAIIRLAQAWLDVIHDQAMTSDDRDTALRTIENAQQHLLGRHMRLARLRLKMTRGRKRDTR